MNVEEESDPDGDPVLHVIVVYEMDDRELDPAGLSGRLRLLRPALSEHGEDRFPVMSFVAQEDYAAPDRDGAHWPHGSLKANTPIGRLQLPEDNLSMLHKLARTGGR